MPDLDAAILAYGALLDETLVYGPSPERDAAISQAHQAVLVARHAEDGCAFCIPAEADDAATLAHPDSEPRRTTDA